jgi:hypothetical protein
MLAVQHVQDVSYTYFPQMHAPRPKLELPQKDIWGWADGGVKINELPSSVGQLMGECKWKKRLADWIMDTRVGLVGMSFVILKRNGWKEMPDGDVTHSPASKTKLPMFKTVAVFGFVFYFGSLLLSFYVISTFSLFI